MNIKEVLDKLSYSYCSCNGRLKFKGKVPEGFMDIWNELTTTQLFEYVKSRTGGKCTAPKSIQFLD